MYKFLLGDKEDIEKVLKWLIENEDKTIKSLMDIMKLLYENKDKLKFKKYFKRVYPNNGYGFDPVLCRDLEMLKISGVLIENNGTGIKVNRESMNILLS